MNHEPQKKQLPRRDKCLLAGKRAGMLSDDRAALAWNILALELLGMSELEMPKFKHLLRAIRKANIRARRP